VFQAKFVCSKCGRMLEKSTCCKKPTKLVRGFGRIRNSTVNIISNVFSTVLTLVVCLLIA
jgi:transcription initiation factor IIE alpha subunit